MKSDEVIESLREIIHRYDHFKSDGGPNKEVLFWRRKYLNEIYPEPRNLKQTIICNMFTSFTSDEFMRNSFEENLRKCEEHINGKYC